MQNFLSDLNWEWLEAVAAVIYIYIMRREVKILKKDIDGVALAAKTERALAREKKK